MFLRKDQGGVSVGPYTWATDGDVVEVDDKTGHDLLTIKGAGYTAVDPPEPAAPAKGTAGKTASS
jgi:hypothetical protein